MSYSIPITPVSEAKKKVFLVEDHPLFRAGLRQLINEQPDLVVSGEADSGPVAVSSMRGVETDVAIVDISLKGADGIELVKSVRAEHRDLPLLVLSMHDEGVYAMRALRAGANGYLMKREEPETIVTALRSVMAGEVAVSANFKDQLLSRALKGEEVNETNPVQALTDRELEVLSLVGKGMTSRQIAEKLHLSAKTIESHRLHIKEKLRMQSSPEMVRFAVEWVNRHEAVM